MGVLRLICLHRLPWAMCLVQITACGELQGGLSEAGSNLGQRQLISRATAPAAQDVDLQGARAALTAGTVALSVNLLATLGQAKDRNVLFSPYGLTRALGLLQMGAKGRTAQQLADVLQGNLQAAPLAEAHAAAQAALRAEAKRYKAHTQLRQADAVWGASGIAPSPPFRQAMATAFTDAWHNVDFGAAPGRARDTINQWVCQQTEGQIHDLLARGTPGPSTRLLLTSTLYVSAPWAHPFSAARVHMAPFFGADGKTRQVPTLFGQLRAAYVVAEGWVAVDIPYRAASLSLTLMWPQAGTLAALQPSLDGAKLSRIWGALTTSTVALSLPKFKVEASQGMQDALMTLGAVDVFTAGQADLSGIAAGETSLYVESLLHRTTLEIDERGTQATAATGMVLRPTVVAEHIQTVVVDRPFLLFMRDSAAMTLLFAGRVATLGGVP